MCPQASAATAAPTSILTVKVLKKWVRVDFEVFKIFLKTMLNEDFAKAKGNAFARGGYDGGTLSSKRKYQAFVIQFVYPKWRRNFVICVGSEPCADGRGVAVV